VHEPVVLGRVGALEAVAQERAEGLARVAHDLTVALDHEHGHVERPLDVAREALGLAPEKREQPAAVWVHVQPDQAAARALAADRALVERTVGEHRGDDRRQRHGDAQLLHGVFLGGVVEVRLHGAGAAHHVEPHRALLRQVLAHHAVAKLRHPGQLRLRGERLKAEPEPGDPEIAADRAQLVDVVHPLVVRVVDAAKGRTGELDLPAGLERDRRLSAGECDHVAALVLALGRPAVARDELLEHRAHAARPRVGQRCEGVFEHAELLRLGPHAKRARRLERADEGREQLVVREPMPGRALSQDGLHAAKSRPLRPRYVRPRDSRTPRCTQPVLRGCAADTV
jgi:hypothetical protein